MKSTVASPVLTGNGHESIMDYFCLFSNVATETMKVPDGILFSRSLFIDTRIMLMCQSHMYPNILYVTVVDQFPRYIEVSVSHFFSIFS